MRGGRSTALALAACCTLLIFPVGPALAEDPSPSPTATTTASPSPSSTPTAPEPGATAPTASPSASPSEPGVVPPRGVLPLMAGHYGPLVDLAQERLEWLGYEISEADRNGRKIGKSTTIAVKAFQSKFLIPATGVVDERSWRALSKMASRVGVLPLQCTAVKVALCADKTTRIIRYVEKGEAKVTVDARFGRPGMDTGNGVFSVNRKSRDHVSSRYHTWMPFAMFFNGGEAVHYSPSFAAEGYNGGSHGCIGMRDFKVAAWLFDRVPLGARVYVYYS
ncbi:MAG: L,D-transpeptidase family protein [Actinomycetota bacterium]|nr:L,D-transpeptidase family protein [Actinomycetota bacterium]